MRGTWLLALCLAAGCNFRILPLGSDETPPPSSLDGAVPVSDDGGPPIATSDLGDLDLAHSGPFLMVTSVPAPASVDLTAAGTSDWAHWGYSSASDFDHKMKGGGQISNFQQVGINAPTQFGDGLVQYHWSDGQGGPGHHPMTVPGGTTTGVYVLTGGLQITAPADTNVRKLRLYVGQYNAQGQLDVSLSDNSAPAVSDHSYTSSNGTPVNVEYDILYAASSPGQLIKITWTVLNSSLGNVTLQSAALQSPVF